MMGLTSKTYNMKTCVQQENCLFNEQSLLIVIYRVSPLMLQNLGSQAKM